MHEAKMLVGGDWVDAKSGQTLPVENPANREVFGAIPRGAATDVEIAVKAANDAFAAWSRVAPRERGALLMRIADRLAERQEEIGRAHV